MKKILYMFLICLFALSISGCQYLVPTVIKAGGLEIVKDNEETTPATTVAPNTFEVEITPYKPTTSPKNDEGNRWYIPTKETRR